MTVPEAAIVALCHLNGRSADEQLHRDVAIRQFHDLFDAGFVWVAPSKEVEQSSAVPCEGDASSGAVTNATGWPEGEATASRAAPQPPRTGRSAVDADGIPTADVRSVPSESNRTTRPE